MNPAPLDLLGDTPKRKLGIGYAGSPGKGPLGETCGSCKWCRGSGHSRNYYKCRHEQGYASFSMASDIRLSTLACEFWEGR